MKSKRLLSRRGRSIATGPASVSLVRAGDRFDGTTGQVYTETIQRIQEEDDRDWIYWPSIHSKYAASGKSTNIAAPRKGARSLPEIATSCVARAASKSELSSDSVQHVADRILEIIWEELVNMRLMSGGSKRTDISRFPAQIKVVRSPLDIYTLPLTYKPYEHLTILSITTDFPVPELVQLSSVTNLVSLEISSPTSQVTTVSDRLLHAWHLKSQESGAFSVLRILKLNNHHELTKRSLPYINSFPSLAIYDVSGCNTDLLHGTLPGWQATKEPDLLHLLEAMCHKPSRSTSDLGRYDAWDSEINEMLSRIGEMRGDTDRKNVPVASLRLGEVPWPANRPSTAFIRKKMGKVVETKTGAKLKSLADTTSTTTQQVASTSYEAVSNTIRPARPLAKRKKRNLDDMLSSFM